MNRRRYLAGVIDGIGIFLVTLGTTYLLRDAWPGWALGLLVYLFLSLATIRLARTTPGLFASGLRLTGDGCAVCRELRRIGPFIVLAALGWGAEAIHPWLGYGVLGIALFLLNWRAGEMSGGVLPFDTATGFGIARRD
ncbi:hypothetical protein [Pseudaestuariivita atlantica]|uniref:Uncharacterized protein n=1 Tax=Pseudaestuariivita atlantica TaxID=1317121 RepID=A0A0L1JR13_9RHOB|nr:hypothetical protein [Pseudaestuariivita atlantica]KNG94176.1 hypothetical protein ATO11_08100 [Pseudaestuariivita atlantica]